jgi:uncharacterized membrane protein
VAVQHLTEEHAVRRVGTGFPGPRQQRRWQERLFPRATDERLAKGLGWFSIGLGVAEVAIPGPISWLVGVREHRTLLRAYGLRETAAGIGILTQRRPAGWLWARVAGDALDLATLAIAAGARRSNKGKVAFATASVAGVTAADLYCAVQLSRETLARLSGPARARASIVVNRSPEDLYSFWRDVRNLPRFMKFVQFVQATGDRRSHWIAQPRRGRTTLEWDSEVVDDQPNRLISWRSAPNAIVENAGTVRFEPAPGGRGTLVKLEMHYTAPGGPAARALGKMFGGVSEQFLYEQLRRFKQLVETGEIATIEGQPSGPRTGGMSRLAETLNI